MNKSEQEVIHNIMKRLQTPNCGSSSFDIEKLTAELKEHGIEAVSRLYLNTWIIPALELILEEPKAGGSARRRNLALAKQLTRVG